MTRSVRDIMARDLVTFTPETLIHRAIQILLTQRISGAPVVAENGTLVGMLSKKDCLKVVLSSSYHQDWGGTVADFMSTEIETIEGDLDLVGAARHFLGSHYRRFPIIEDGRLVGQVSRADLLKALIEGS